MFAIVMLTALSMEDASRAAAGDACEYRNRGTYIPHTGESRGRRSLQETKTRTVRQQQPASPAQRDWAGHNPSVSSHAQTRPQQAGSGPDVNTDLLPRDAYELSAWAENNQENSKTKTTKDTTAVMILKDGAHGELSHNGSKKGWNHERETDRYKHAHTNTIPHQRNQSNTTRAARAAQGCTDNGVRVDTGTLRERRSGEERRYRNN